MWQFYAGPHRSEARGEAPCGSARLIESPVSLILDCVW